MTTRPRNRMTAWLGLFAVWLIVFAPIVSQSLVSGDRNTPSAPICSADAPPHAGKHAPTIYPNACGYCDLLLHHVAVPMHALPQPQVAQRYDIAQPSGSSDFVHREVLPAGRPRDSPRFV